MKKVLSVASECVPFIKTGGLADVVGALPRAMSAQGVEMRVMLPGYPAVMTHAKGAKAVHQFDALFGGPASLLSVKGDRFTALVLDAPHLFDRSGAPYLGADGRDWPDNPERFAALSWAAADYALNAADGWRADLLHGHDWQAGLAPYYLRRVFKSDLPTVFSVHNIAFHGQADATKLAALKLDRADFHRDGLEFWGRINALKSGLVYSDKITTVSPTYARELMREEFGAGLDGVLRHRRQDVTGILNGIDTDVWNPASDREIAAVYRTPRGKQRNRKALRQEFGLPESPGPLCCVISRLTDQKGLDLLLAALPALLDRGGQLMLLGSGDAALEKGFRDAAAHPNVAVRIGYDEALSHRIIAGSDAILVPSRFEPCGLTQLYGLRYGTIPVVAFTGGLADTVINASPAARAAKAATGLQIHPLTIDSVAMALSDLCDLFDDKDEWLRMQRNAMAQPVGWERSAAAYAELYTSVTRR